MIWDSAGYVLPHTLTELLSCSSEAERKLKGEILFGNNWENWFRNFEKEQFFQLAGMSYSEFSRSGGYWNSDKPAPWLVTGFQVQTGNGGEIPCVIFSFNYTTDRTLNTNINNIFAYQNDFIKSGEIVFYRGEWDEKFEKVLLNMAELRCVGSFSGKNDVKNELSRLLHTVKMILL